MIEKPYISRIATLLIVQKSIILYMAQLIIYNPDQTVYTTVNIGEDTVCNMDLMGQNKVSANITSPVPLSFKYNMYIEERGSIYRIKDIPKRVKNGMRLFTYSAVFEGREYTLHNKQMKYNRRLKFSYYGNLRSHLQLILDNANVIDPGWVIGSVDNSELKVMEYDKTSCRDAITKLAELFEVEYEFKGRDVNMKATVGGVVQDVVLKYGKNNGLKSVTAEPAGDEDFATVFYGIGSADNLPDTYREGIENLTFDPGFVQANVDLYGVIEATVEFDDIKPEFFGRVAGITTRINEIVDTSIDFDLTQQMVDGQAQIVFTSGALGGKQYEITLYNPATKTVRFNVTTERNGYVHPNTNVRAMPGDTYKFIGIEMPQSYITNAEARLQTRLSEYAIRNSHPTLKVSFDTDEMFIREHNLIGAIEIGDKLDTFDTDLEISQLLRVSSLTYPIANPSAISFVLSDKVIYTSLAKTIVDKKQQEVALKELNEKSYEDMRINSIRRRELQGMVFDPDGLFDGSKIKPNTVGTLQLTVGARSQDFMLEMLLKPNYKGNPNSFASDSGKLTHLTIDPNAIKVWNLPGGEGINVLTSSTAYYIYAKCNRGNLSGVLDLSTEQRKFDSDPTFYYFLIGVLSSVINGVRVISLTYGATEINGRFVTTGRVQSQDGKTYFDLDEGVISGQIKFVSNNGTVKNVTDLETAIDNIETGAPNILSYRPANYVNGYYNSGVPVYDDGYIRSTGFFKVKGNQKYTLSCSPGSHLVLLEYNASNQYLGVFHEVEGSDTEGVTFTTVNGSTYVNCYAYKSNLSAITPEYARTLRAQLEEGTKRTPWKQSPQDIFEDLNDESLGSEMGRNYFKETSPLAPNDLTTLLHVNDVRIDGLPSDAPQDYLNGFFAVGHPTNRGTVRINGVITGNGYWTVSFKVASNGGWPMLLDICDNASKTIQTGSAWQHVEFTVNVQNWTEGVYNFVDFSEIPYVYLYVADLMIEKGQVAHEWSAAPEDVARKIAEAKKRLDDMGADGKLTPPEKIQLWQDWNNISAEYGSMVVQGQRYEQSTAAYDNAVVAFRDFVNTYAADKTTTTDIDRAVFTTIYTNYYSTKEDLQNRITITQKNWSGGRNYLAGKAMTQDPEFATTNNGLSVYNNKADGTVILERHDSTWYGERVPNNSGIAMAVICNNAGDPDGRPGRGGFTFNNGMEANSILIYRLLMLVPEGNTIEWASNDLGAGSTVTWNTPRKGNGRWGQEFIITVKAGSPLTPTAGAAGYFWMAGANGGGFHVSSASYYDMTNYKNPNREDVNSVTTFKNFFSFQVNTPINGFAVFKTKIPAANNMITMTIKGYNFAETNANIDVQLGFYTNSPDNGGTSKFDNATFSSKGDCVITEVYVGKGADGYVWFLLRTPSGAWQYPKFTIESMIMGYSGVPQGVDLGWRGYVSDDWPQGEPYAFIQLVKGVVGESTSGANQKMLQAKSEAAVDAQQKANQAQAAAAADATGKSNAAAEDAKAYARQQRAELTAQLKITAFQDIQEWAIRDGVTLVQGGFINTVAIDVVALRANMITADFIASTIVTAGTVNAVNINAGSIQSGTIDSARINADTLIAKNIKTATSGRRTEITAATNEMRFYTDGIAAEIVRVGSAAQLNGNPGSLSDSGLVIQVDKGSGNLATTNVTANGIFANGGLMPMASVTSGFYTVGCIGGLLSSKDLSSRTAAGVFIQANSLWGVAECHSLYTVGDRVHAGAEYYDPEVSFVSTSGNNPNYTVPVSVRLVRFTGTNQGSGNIYLSGSKKGRIITLTRDAGGNAIRVNDANGNFITNLGATTLNFYHTGSGWFPF